MLYEEGVTLTLEADVGTTLDAWTEVSPVVVVVVVGLVPLSEATTEISESFTHCSLAQGKQLGKLQNRLLTLAAKTK